VDNIEMPTFPLEYYKFQPGCLSLLNPIPCALDARIRDLCDEFAQLIENDRRTFSSTLSTDDFDTLRYFAVRSAVFALQEQDADLVKRGLIAVTMMEKERYEFRDILIALSLLYYTAYRIGEDPDRLFRDAADLAEPGVSKVIARYTEHKAKGENPDAGIYQEVQTKFGAGFVERYFNPYEPRSDLLSIALELTPVFDRDCYTNVSITIASLLPDVWFKYHDQGILESTLNNARGGGTFTADLNPGVYSQGGRQGITVFLFEFEQAESADFLRKISDSNGPYDHARLAITVDCLFCLVIGCSFDYGVESFEKGDSLNRFKTDIENAMKEGAQLPFPRNEESA
jgi:hypothetical protein